MPRKKAPAKPAAHTAASAFGPARSGQRSPATSLPTVPARWLFTAMGLTILAAAVCAWGALCLLFWQGSWQLLYHPASALTRTPANVGLAFDPVAFASTEAGEPRLRGWWIAAGANGRFSRYTVLYLHGQNGNLSDAVDALAALHAVGVNVLAFDYRGYGQSQFARPSEAHWREDAEWALHYLTGTRHIAASTILLDGRELGANLALEIGAAHPELAGVVVELPLEAPADAIFRDPRALLIPAHALMRDRFALHAPAAALRIPSLWFYWTAAPGQVGSPQNPDAFQKATAPKMLVWLAASSSPQRDFANSLSRWLDDLPNSGRN